MLAPNVRAGWVVFNAPLEGVIPWMYLDVKGLVTTAIGVLIDPVEQALYLPWVHKVGGEPATREQIRAEWLAIKGQPALAKQGAAAAGQLARLRLTPSGVEQVTLAKLDVMARALVESFPGLPSWPWQAQMATLSLCWAVGTALPRGWPRLTASLRAQDWTAAAEECEIRSEGNPGVVPRNRRNRALFLEAAQLGATVPAPPPTEPIPEGEVLALVADTLDGTVKDLLAEGYRAR